jgi:YbbR domain-containing protein
MEGEGQMNELMKKDISIKAVSILLAVLFWFYVLNVDNPYELKRIPINVRIENESSLQEKGLVLKNNIDSTIEITVRGRKEILESLSPSDFIATIDFSKIKSDEDKYLKIEGPYHNINDISIATVSPRVINLELEKIRKNSFPVEVQLEGTLKDNYKILDYKIAPQNIMFEDVESLISNVASVRAVVDINGLDRDVNRQVECKVYNKEGKEIPSLSKNLRVDFVLEVAKEVPIDMVIIGQPAGEYVEVSRTVNPQTALIRGAPEILDKVTEIETEPISIENIEQSIVVPGKLKLPEGVSLVNTPKDAEVSVEVEKLLTKEFIIPRDSISILNEGALACDINTQSVSITVKGKLRDLNALTQNRINAAIDVGELREGTHIAPLSISLPPGFELVGEYSVEVKITNMIGP